MAKKVLLKDKDNVEVLPITRGELILDSSGNPALHSKEFLANDDKPGLLPASIQISPVRIDLTKEWRPSGFILNETNGFETGVYLIKIMYTQLMFTGIVSVYVGEINVEDEIVLHMSGNATTYTDGTQGRIFAKVAPNSISQYGEIYLATSVPESNVTNLTITMKKLL